MKWRSPLKIPPQRGRLFRLILSGALGTLAGWAITQLWIAARTGIFDWTTKYGQIHIEQAVRPALFWLYIAGFVLGFLWLLYACCAEILYAILWYERA
jgi:hypothetical protein